MPPLVQIPRDWLYIGTRGITAFTKLALDAGVTTSTIANVAHYPVSPHEMYGAAPGGKSYPPVHFDTTSLCHTGSVAGTIAESLDLRDVVWLDATPFVAQPGASGSVHDEEVFDKVRCLEATITAAYMLGTRAMHVCSGRTVAALAKKASASVQVKYAGGLVRVFAIRFRLLTATVATMFILAGAHYSGLREESVSMKWAPTDLAAASLRNITVTSAHLAQVVAAPVTAKNPSKKEYKDWIASLPAAVRAWAEQKGLLAPPAKPADRGLAVKRIRGYWNAINETGLFDPANTAAVAAGRSDGGRATVINKTGLFDPANAAAVAANGSEGGRATVINKKGLFDPANTAAVAAGRSDGGKTMVINKKGLFDPANAAAVAANRSKVGRATGLRLSLPTSPGDLSLLSLQTRGTATVY
ncbi:fibrinogen alpha-1 [Micractinium conductrix]|uniref:Fibrinogen alpha-1 n=1 Tax=Micractinium conductrix TaxID=554055 RepID=A0A2P6VDM1_9CHLO|nr:fibrinogen alpha-1 [Micractinium conductrix]|eukprot:PSC72188.1 fibrinogen alpha-1 [Micractinium conductrix]